MLKDSLKNATNEFYWELSSLVLHYFQSYVYILKYGVCFIYLSNHNNVEYI